MYLNYSVVIFVAAAQSVCKKICGHSVSVDEGLFPLFESALPAFLTCGFFRLA